MWINRPRLRSVTADFGAVSAHASEKQVEIMTPFVDKVWVNLQTAFSTAPPNLFNSFYILPYYRETG